MLIQTPENAISGLIVFLSSKLVLADSIPNIVVINTPGFNNISITLFQSSIL